MATATIQPAAGLLEPVVAPGRREFARRLLLACGAAYSLLYVLVNDVVAASLTEGYSRFDQAISELSATGAPAKAFLTAVSPAFTALLIAFGVGVWLSAGRGRAVRVAGGLLVAHGLTSVLWLFAPMSRREVIGAGNATPSDALHLALAALTVIFILAEIGVAAVAFGRAFRVYSAATLVVIAASGISTGVLSAGLEAAQPTPWLGFLERVSIGGWLLWMVALAAVLWPLRPARQGRAASVRVPAT